MVKKSRKSFISLLIAFIMVFAMVPATAFAANNNYIAFRSIGAKAKLVELITDEGDFNVNAPDYDSTDADGYFADWYTEYGAPNAYARIEAMDGYKITDCKVKRATTSDFMDSNISKTVTNVDKTFMNDNTVLEITYDVRNYNTEIIVTTQKISNVAATTVDLVLGGGQSTNVSEYQTVNLTANVESDGEDVSEGYVLFKLPDADQKVIPVYDGSAELAWKVPSELVGKNISFKAIYLGTESYSQSEDDASVRNKVNSVTIAPSAAAKIVADPNVTTLTTRTEYELSLANNSVLDTAGNELTEDDYTVTWYESRGGAFDECDNIVEPQNTSYVYKALVEPNGGYEFGAFELVIGCGQMLEPTIQLNAPSEEFEGQDVTVTATLGNDIAGGTVVFFANDGEHSIRLGEASVVKGEASITFNNLPAGINGTNKTYEITAAYTGVESVYSTAEVTLDNAEDLEIKSSRLPDNTWKLVAEDADGTGIELTEMVPLESYTLSLATDNEADELTFGSDYEIIWKISKDDGLTWNDIDLSNYDDYNENDGSIVVVPETAETQYALYVMPIGDYASPENGIAVEKATCTEFAAKVTVEFTVSNEEPYEHELITFTAKAYSEKEVKNDDGDEYTVYTPVIGGTFTLIDPDGNNIGDYAVDGAGMVRVTVPARDYSDGSAETYKAIYSGTSTYASKKSSCDVTVVKEIVEAPVVTITPDGSAYQSNDVKIQMYVSPEEGKGAPTGTVAFYWTDYVEDFYDNYLDKEWNLIIDNDAYDSNYISVDEVSHIAQVVTNTLPVNENGEKRQLIIRADYSGDSRYLPVTQYYGVGDDTVEPYTIKSSVIDRSKIEVINPDGGDTLPSDGSKTYLTLVAVKTLDGENLSYNVDYTVEWQRRPTNSADIDNWEIITEGTSHQLEINPTEDYAYRAKVTAVETSVKAKASYINYGTSMGETAEELWQGTRENYSDTYNNKVVTGESDVQLSLNAVPASSGAIAGDDLVVNVNAFGGEVTPTGEVVFTILGRDNDVEYTSTKNIVSGWNSFTYEEIPAGRYLIVVGYNSTNSYVADPSTEGYIVRLDDFSLDVSAPNELYNGEQHFLDEENANITGVGSAFDSEIEKLAKNSVVYTYYDEDGNLIEAPVNAGTYTVKAWLPESKYWTEKTDETTFTIDKRQLTISEVVALNKVYEGTKSISVLKVELTYAAVGTNGLPTGTTGVTEGDSVYATVSGALDSELAGRRTYTVTGVELHGPDADNYYMNTGYTQTINVMRNQLKGEIASGIVLRPSDKINASQVKLFDQAGNKFTDYTVSYYLHDGNSILKVSNTKAEGLYSVVVQPKSANYKGGAIADVYVSSTEQVNEGTFSPSEYNTSIISVGNTEVEYGTDNATGIRAAATNSEISAIEYLVDGLYTTTVPTDAGRYAVKVTASTGDYVMALYTVHKSTNPNTEAFNIADTVYGDIYEVGNGFISFTGGRLADVSYLAPVDAGTYLATTHYAESENYVEYTTQDTFTIEPKALTVTADRKYAELYQTSPTLRYTFEDIDGESDCFEYNDNSIDALIAQPTMIAGEANSEDAGLNNIGRYEITPSNAIAHNYSFDYVAQDMTKIDKCPQEQLEIVGMPQGIIEYDDEFLLGAYGCKDDGRHIDSSEINWSSEGAIEVDVTGYAHATSVGEYTITLTKGSGDYAISTTIEGEVVKKFGKILIDDTDSVYTDMDVYGDDEYAFVLSSLDIDDLEKSKCDIIGEPETEVGDYIIVAEIKESDEYYTGIGAGRLSIHKANSYVKAQSDSDVIYGSFAGEIDENFLEKGLENEQEVNTNTSLILPGGVSIYNTIKSNSDVGVYNTFVGSGTENANFSVDYKTGTVEIVKADLDFYSTVLKGTSIDSSIATLKAADAAEVDTSRLYGDCNQILYFYAEGLQLDTLADILKGEVIAVYEPSISEDANVKFNTVDDYFDGKSGYAVTGIEESLDSRNYNITMKDILENISQRPIQVTIAEPFSIVAGIDWADAYKYTTVTTDKLSGVGGLAQHTTHADPNYINDQVADLGLAPVEKTGTVAINESGSYTFKVTNNNYYAGTNNTELVHDNPIQVNVSEIGLVAEISQKTRTSFTVRITNNGTPISNIDGIKFIITNDRTDKVAATGTLRVGTNGYYYATYPTIAYGKYTITFEKDGYSFN